MKRTSGSDIEGIIASALASLSVGRVKMMVDESNYRYDDAWTSHSMNFGPTVEHISSVEQLRNTLNGKLFQAITPI